MSKESTARNTKVRAERHAKRMASQAVAPRIPRGTARNLRRVPLQLAYAKRVAKGAIQCSV